MPVQQKNEELYKKLEKKLYKWWQPLSEGSFIIIYKDYKYKLFKSSKKTRNAKLNEIKDKWIEYGSNKDIIGIIWSAISVDIIQQVIYYLLYKINKNELSLLLKEKNLPKYLIQNYKKFFKKSKIYTNKDYIFKLYSPK